MVFNAARSLAAELPAGDLLDLGAVDNSPLADYIGGAKMVWNGGTSVSVTSGAMYIQSLAKVVAFPSTLTLSSLSLAASTWHHLYGYLNAGTPAIELSTTAPAAAYSGFARSKTGDTSRRYIGSTLTDGTGALLGVKMAASKAAYLKDCTTTPNRVLSNGMATTSTNISLSGAVPITSGSVTIVAQNLDPSKAAVIGSSLGSAQIYTLNPGGRYALDFPVDGSQNMTYLMAAGAVSGLYIDVIGYTVER